MEFAQPSDRLATTLASLAREHAKAEEVAFPLLESPCQLEHLSAPDRLTAHLTWLLVAAFERLFGLSRQWSVSPGLSAPYYRICFFFQRANSYALHSRGPRIRYRAAWQTRSLLAIALGTPALSHL